jgi:hypothetical protein
MPLPLRSPRLLGRLATTGPPFMADGEQHHPSNIYPNLKT